MWEDALQDARVTPEVRSIWLSYWSQVMWSSLFWISFRSMYLMCSCGLQVSDLYFSICQGKSTSCIQFVNCKCQMLSK